MTNLPTPYRVNFFNELAHYYDLTVIFEAKYIKSIKFNWIREEDFNFKYHFLTSNNLLGFVPNFKILKYMKKNYYDYIILTNYSNATEILTALYVKLRKIRFIYEFDGAINRKESKIKILIKKFLLKGAAGYFSPSISTDNVIRKYTNNDVKIMRYSFTSLFAKDILKAPLSLVEKREIRKKFNIYNEKIIIAVGQFIHRKGFDILLQATNKMVSTSDVGIYIVGGKPTKEFITLVETGRNSKNVHFIEFLSSSELKELYKASDLFVLPTREDVWGLVINEALSNGLPVISTYNCVAAVELVKNDYNGRLINSEDISQLSKILDELVDNSSLTDIYSLNALKAIQNYTFENMAEQHFNELTKI
jgi:glycosyltransferase involved in cell wall biosynthesis